MENAMSNEQENKQPKAVGRSQEELDLLLGAAAREGKLGKIKTFLRQGARPSGARDDEGLDPMMAAASYASVECAELLIRHGADLLAADNQGLSALMLAAMSPIQGAAMIRALAEGSNADRVGENGLTAAMIGILSSDNQEKIEALLAISSLRQRYHHKTMKKKGLSLDEFAKMFGGARMDKVGLIAREAQKRAALREAGEIDAVAEKPSSKLRRAQKSL